MHHVTHVPWCMPGSLTSCFIWSRWRGRRSRHSRRMHNPRFCVSGKRPVGGKFLGLGKGDMNSVVCLPVGQVDFTVLARVLDSKSARPWASTVLTAKLVIYDNSQRWGLSWFPVGLDILLLVALPVVLPVFPLMYFRSGSVLLVFLKLLQHIWPPVFQWWFRHHRWCHHSQHHGIALRSGRHCGGLHLPEDNIREGTH